MFLNFLIAQGILIAHNEVNVFIDAYKIKKALSKNIPKTIRHGVNFAAYAVTVGILSRWLDLSWWDIIIFCISAFCNRQIFFDIPLNWRRGLKWDYVTPDPHPGSVLDRIEISIFGRNGRTPVYAYLAQWVLTLAIGLFFM